MLPYDMKENDHAGMTQIGEELFYNILRFIVS